MILVLIKWQTGVQRMVMIKLNMLKSLCDLHDIWTDCELIGKILLENDIASRIKKYHVMFFERHLKRIEIFEIFKQTNLTAIEL